MDDYVLSQSEQKAIEDYKNIDFIDYNIKSLFDVLTSKKRFDANKVKILDNGKYPYVVRKSSNNGQKGYIEEEVKYLNEANTISFGQDTATVFYQNKPYFTGDKIKILKYRKGILDLDLALYFTSTIFKSFANFSWGASSFSVNVIKNKSIKVPVKDGEIDFDTMREMIKITKKLVIKDVINFTNQKLDVTK